MAVIQHTEKNGGGSGGDDYDDIRISGWMYGSLDQWKDSGKKEGGKHFQVVWNSLQVFCTSKNISDKIWEISGIIFKSFS